MAAGGAAGQHRTHGICRDRGAANTFARTRASPSRALKEYATFAAWSYAQHLTDTLFLIEREAIGAVNHGMDMHTDPNVPAAYELAHYLPWDDVCQCHRPPIRPGSRSVLRAQAR